MQEARELNPAAEPLFKDPDDLPLQSVGPFLFPFQACPPFNRFFFDLGWGCHWGVIVQAATDLPTLSSHFRKFLKVHTDHGLELYFRFYDPRVLRIFLPTCDRSQLMDFFGPVRHFILEDEDRRYALKFSLQNGMLSTLRMSHAQVLEMYVTNEAEAPAAPPNPAEVRKTSPRKPRWDMFP